MITSPQAVNFSNQNLRVMADSLAKLYDLAVIILNDWNANGGAGLLPPALPTLTPITTTGTLATGTYGYRVSALNALGETLASTEATAAVVGPTGKVTVTWLTVAGATSYNVYGRTVGAELLMGNTAALTFADSGGTTPAGAMPTTNTTGLIPNDSETINDGAATDGRMIVTGIKANNMINRCLDIKNLMEGSVAVATNDGSKSVLNTVYAYAVNLR